MVTPDCNRVLLVLYDFGLPEGLDGALAEAKDGLRRYWRERWEAPDVVAQQS